MLMGLMKCLSPQNTFRVLGIWLEMVSLAPCFQSKCPLVSSSGAHVHAHSAHKLSPKGMCGGCGSIAASGSRHLGQNRGVKDAVFSQILISELTDTWMTAQEQYGGMLCFFTVFLLHSKNLSPFT